MGLISDGSNLGREVHGPKALWSENDIRTLYKLSIQSMDMLPTSRCVAALVAAYIVAE